MILRRIFGACLILAPFLAAYHFLPFDLFRVVALSALFVFYIACCVVLLISTFS